MKTQPTKANAGKGTLWLRSAGTLRSLVIALIVLLAAAGNASAQVTGGTWAQLTHEPCSKGQPCFTPDQALLLTDGTVMVQNYYGNDWYRLSPDQYGNYANGTWNQIASLPAGYAPFAYGSAVLPNGKVIIEGGEKGIFGPNCQGPRGLATNCGAIYDPVKNMWTAEPPPDFGDMCGSNGTTWCVIAGAPTVVLPDGTFMMGDAGYLGDNYNLPPAKLQAFLPPPYTGTWMQADPNGTKHDGNGEEGWTLLPSVGSFFGPLSLVMTVDTYSRVQLVCNGYNSSELYIKELFYDSWSCLGNTPNMLYPNVNEMGPAILRPDGTVFQAGADQYTAILSPITTLPPLPNLWTAGPNFPLDSNGSQLEIEDGPAALLPNGNVLMMASEDETTPPATFLELTPAPQNQLVVVSGPPYANNLSSNEGQMLLLPTGEVLLIPHFGVSSYLEIYTPTNPNYDPSWAPVICGGSCSYNQPVVIYNNYRNQISGLRFNGMSQGAAFGDEYQSATNYPLIRITDYSGFQPMVYYCRTHDHTSMGVQTGNLKVSTFFDCPDVPTGTVGDLEVVANGIPSNPMLVVVVQVDPCEVQGPPYC